MKRHILFAIVLICTALLAFAQQPSPIVQSREFEVASVKPNRERLLTMSGITRMSGGRLSARAVILKGLIAFAYRVKEREVVGGPGWIDSERYDIEAKAADSNEGSASELRLMLQTLIAERFQLKDHTETKEVPGMNCALEKTGRN